MTVRFSASSALWTLLSPLLPVQHNIGIFKKSELDQITFLNLSCFSHWNRETSDLITCVADLQYNNQKLQEENNKLKLTLEAVDETNNKLLADNEDLQQQIKRSETMMAQGLQCNGHGQMCLPSGPDFFMLLASLVLLDGNFLNVVIFNPPT